MQTARFLNFRLSSLEISSQRNETSIDALLQSFIRINHDLGMRDGFESRFDVSEELEVSIASGMGARVGVCSEPLTCGVF